MVNENVYQANLKKKIEARFPGSIVTKNDTTFVQGFPDLLILNGNKYAMLEVKRSANEPHRPNQDWYVNKFKSIGVFASFIFPENEEEVLYDLEQSFKVQ